MEKILEAIDTANKIIGEWEWKRRQAYHDKLNSRTDEMREVYQKNFLNADLNKRLVMFYLDGLEYALRCIREEDKLQ